VGRVLRETLGCAGAGHVVGRIVVELGTGRNRGVRTLTRPGAK
jgi:hypothetical protein